MNIKKPKLNSKELKPVNLNAKLSNSLYMTLNSPIEDEMSLKLNYVNHPRSYMVYTGTINALYTLRERVYEQICEDIRGMNEE